MPKRKFVSGRASYAKRAKHAGVRRSVLAKFARRRRKRAKRSFRKAKFSVLRMAGVLPERLPFKFVNRVLDLAVEPSATAGKKFRPKNLYCNASLLYNGTGAGHGGISYNGTPVASTPYCADYFLAAAAAYSEYRVTTAKIVMVVKFSSDQNHRFALVAAPDGHAGYDNNVNDDMSSIFDDPSHTSKVYLFKTTGMTIIRLTKTVNLMKMPTKSRDSEWSGIWNADPIRPLWVTLLGYNTTGFNDVNNAFAHGGACQVDVYLTQTGYLFNKTTILGDVPMV